MGMIIRKGMPGDADMISMHQLLMALETEQRHLDETTVLEGVRSVFTDETKGFYIVAEEDGKVVGNLMVTPEWSDWTNRWAWWIQSVYVQAPFRRRGVYRALYDMVRSLARQDGIKVIRLYVDQHNENAMQVYKKLNMQHSHYMLYEEIL